MGVAGPAPPAPACMITYTHALEPVSVSGRSCLPRCQVGPPSEASHAGSGELCHRLLGVARMHWSFAAWPSWLSPVGNGCSTRPCQRRGFNVSGTRHASMTRTSCGSVLWRAWQHACMAEKSAGGCREGGQVQGRAHTWHGRIKVHYALSTLIKRLRLRAAWHARTVSAKRMML